MQVAKHAVVEIDYTLTDDDGNVLDTSEGGHPLAYLHGAGNLIPGLESALEGKSAGDSLQVSVPPERAYGKRDDALVQEVPRSQFGSVKDLSVGMQFQATSNAGTHIVRVVEITDAACGPWIHTPVMASASDSIRTSSEKRNWSSRASAADA